MKYTLVAAILMVMILTACQEERYVGSLIDYPGIKDGRLKAYSTFGVISEEADYHMDTLHGERILYDTLGRVRIREQYDKGRFHGPYYDYYPDGKPKVEGQYNYDEMVGIWSFYYEGGQKRADITMKDNMENGPFTDYHPNGNLRTKGHYKGGDFEEGELLLYDSTGVLFKRMDCEGGKCYTQWELGDDDMK